MDQTTEMIRDAFLKGLLTPGWICVYVLVLLGAVISILRPYIKGKTGEATSSFILHRLPKNEYMVLDNIMLRTASGTTQIDHVVVSKYGIFVVETKNYSGLITGSKQADQWTQHFNKKKYSLKNPIYQNYGHIVALSNLLELPVNVFFNIVAFDNSAKLNINNADEVVNIPWLKDVILSHKEELLDASLIQEYVSKILANNIDSKETRKEHNQEVRVKKVTRDTNVANGVCPKCGGRLILRDGKYGKFYGCSNYPKCRFTQKA